MGKFQIVDMTKFRQYSAEFAGTFLLVFFGTAAVSSAGISGALMGLGQVASVWGCGVALSIYCVGHISGAHLNPAVTIAFATWDTFPWSNVIGYIVAQFLGSLCAAGLNWGLYSTSVARFEQVNGIQRGAPGSERSALIFGEYFPNPGTVAIPANATSEQIALLQSFISPTLAFFAELVGTAILMFIILCLIDRKNSSVLPQAVPALIGMTVATLISVLAPISQAGFNPARDFAPRLVALAVGFGDVAIPGPRGGFWVYILGPIVGAQVGAGLHYVLYKLASGDAEENKTDTQFTLENGNN
ncbi:UNVERIFIED_CONTAM: hypothetical protein HDU68_004366 [Siphonaria sp. JEL0065]|nr:hypothetical protein HDU68_004366 [Siphonaria sp. JEL0065]